MSTNDNQYQPITQKQIKESYFHFAQDRDPVNFGLVEKWRKIERPLSASTKVLFQSEIEMLTSLFDYFNLKLRFEQNCFNSLFQFLLSLEISCFCIFINWTLQVLRVWQAWGEDKTEVSILDKH